MKSNPKVKRLKSNLTRLNEKIERIEKYRGGEFDWLNSVDGVVERCNHHIKIVKTLLKEVRKEKQPLKNYTAVGVEVLNLYPFSKLKNKKLNNFKQYWRWHEVEGFGAINLSLDFKGGIYSGMLTCVWNEGQVIDYVQKYEKVTGHLPVFTIMPKSETWYEKITIK